GRKVALDGLLHLAGLQAAGADVGALRLAGEEDAHALQVRVEPPLRGDHRVAAVVPERGRLSADCANLRHSRRMVAKPRGPALSAMSGVRPLTCPVWTSRRPRNPAGAARARPA